MKKLTSRQKILFGVYAMILAMAGDYLLGFGTFSFSDSPDAYMGITANVVPDWRYAVSSILGFLCAALFAVAAIELMKVMEKKYSLADSRLYQLFQIANWGGILYFAFIHIGICMLPVVFNAGMDATGSLQTSMDMLKREFPVSCKVLLWLIGKQPLAICEFLYNFAQKLLCFFRFHVLPPCSVLGGTYICHYKGRFADFQNQQSGCTFSSICQAFFRIFLQKNTPYP